MLTLDALNGFSGALNLGPLYFFVGVTSGIILSVVTFTKVRNLLVGSKR